MKKTSLQPQPNNDKRPKTELDEKFLSVATQVMKAHGITSDRAISLELGRNADFINKVRRGLQSAPADAWDTLLNKYPEARTISNTNVMSQGGGQAIGVVHGNANYHTSLDDCQKELTSARVELEQLREKVASQAALLDSKDALIAAQADTINLLRASYNRPN